jgi:hypothetical protein
MPTPTRNAGEYITAAYTAVGEQPPGPSAEEMLDNIVFALSEDWPDLRTIGKDLYDLVGEFPGAECYACDGENDDDRQGCCWQAWLQREIAAAARALLAQQQPASTEIAPAPAPEKGE